MNLVWELAPELWLLPRREPCLASRGRSHDCWRTLLDCAAPSFEDGRCRIEVVGAVTLLSELPGGDELVALYDKLMDAASEAGVDDVFDLLASEPP